MPEPSPPPHPPAPARLLAEAQALSAASGPGYIAVTAVCAVLNQAGAGYVVIGGPVIGCYTGIARASKDVDCIVAGAAFTKAVSALHAAFPALSVQRLPAVTRFVERDDRVERIDCLRADSDLNQAALASARSIDVSGTAVPIPDLASLFALKFAAALSDSRPAAKRAYDEGDLIALVTANPGIDRERVSALCETIATGYGALAERFIDHALGGDAPTGR